MQLMPTAGHEISGIILDENGADRVINRSFLDHQVQGDLPFIPAQGPGIRVRVLSVYISSGRKRASFWSFKSNTTNITATNFLAEGANNIVLPHQVPGWFQTAPNEALVLDVQNTVAAEFTGVTITWVQAT